MKKIGLKTFFLIILASTIALSPSFSFGRLEGGKAIEIRAEDILLVFLGLIWLTGVLISGKERFEKPPLFFPILAWITVGVLTVLTNWIFRNIELWRGFFFLLKEVEFFVLYFYLFYHISKIDTIKFLIKVWIFLGAINVAWIIFELITGLKITYFYGPTAIMEPTGTNTSGGFFLLLFIFLFNFFLYYYSKLNISYFKKNILFLVISILPLGVITSGSRASFVGLISGLFFTFLFYFIKRRMLVQFSIVISAAAIIFILLLLIYQNSFFIPDTGVSSGEANRLLEIRGFLWQFTSGDPLSRVGIWKTQLTEAFKRPLFLIFGYGKSAILVYGESHSQYVRNLVETGIVGSVVFLILFCAVLKKSWRGFLLKDNSLLIGLSAGLLVATLSMFIVSITVEAFILVKIAEVYWFFTALTLTGLYLYHKQTQKICAE